MKNYVSAYFIIIFLLTINIASGKSNNLKKFLPDYSNNKISKEDSSSSKIPEGMTANKVIENYIKALGGKDNLRKVEDRTTAMTSNINGHKITMTIYQKAPDKMRQIVDLGSFKQNIYFDGSQGMMEVEDKKLEVKGNELEKLKFESTLDLLINLDSLGIKLKLDGIYTVNEKETYKIEMILPSGTKWIQYYDSQSGLKVEESKDITAPQGTYTQITFLGDYREVNGIKYPFSIKQEVGQQKIKFEVSTIQVNTGLADKLFEIK